MKIGLARLLCRRCVVLKLDDAATDAAALVFQVREHAFTHETHGGETAGGRYFLFFFIRIQQRLHQALFRENTPKRVHTQGFQAFQLLIPLFYEVARVIQFRNPFIFDMLEIERIIPVPSRGSQVAKAFPQKLFHSRGSRIKKDEGTLALGWYTLFFQPHRTQLPARGLDILSF